MPKAGIVTVGGKPNAGKSTLLNLIGCIDKPTSGRILIEGTDTSRLTASQTSVLRREKIGFVFQTFNLIPVFTDLISDAESPVSAFQKIDDGGYSFLFESVEKSDQAGRYSFVGSRPRVLFESRGKTIRIVEDGGDVSEAIVAARCARRVDNDYSRCLCGDRSA